jgi:hypothetical protein
MVGQRWAFYDTDGWLASGRERAEVEAARAARTEKTGEEVKH